LCFENGIYLRSEDWVERAIASPDRRETDADGNIHYLKGIPERGDRILRVIVNAVADPCRIVTAFFDRRVKGKP
jgi:hypothetical protein